MYEAIPTFASRDPKIELKEVKKRGERENGCLFRGKER